jgi:hypothetical protein
MIGTFYGKTTSRYFSVDADLERFVDTLPARAQVTISGTVAYLNEPGRGVALPVYAYVHGGVALCATTTPRGQFTCPWDAGLAGIVYAPREAICNHYGVKRLTRQLREHVLAKLAQEMELRADRINGYDEEWEDDEQD